MKYKTTLISLFISFNVLANSLDINRYEIINKKNDIDNISKQLNSIADFHLDQSNIENLGNNGIYKISENSTYYYLSKNGKIIIKGLALENNGTSLKLFKQKNFSHEVILFDKDDGILYKSSSETKNGLIYAFVDYSCPFCKKFHDNTMPVLLNNGYSVLYLPILKNPNIFKVKDNMENIFCADADKRKKLLENAFTNKNITIPESKKCNLDFYYLLGDSMKIKGTPALFSESGLYLGGNQDYEGIVNQL